MRSVNIIQYILIPIQEENSRGCFTVGGGVDRVTTKTCTEEGRWLGSGVSKIVNVFSIILLNDI